MSTVPIAQPRQGARSPLSHRFLRRPWLLALSALVVVAGSYGAAHLWSPAPSHALSGTALTVPPPGGSIDNAGDSLARIDQAIGVWSGNLQRDAEDFVSATNLADLYYSRARLTGNVDDYVRATEAVNRSLASYPDGLAAQQLHAQLLFATHDFAGALKAARAIYRAHPDQVDALATVGDAELELGAYDDASRTFAMLARVAPGAAVTAREAHLAALRGDVAGGIRLAARAITESTASGATSTDRSWYEYLAGYLAYQFGDLTTAERQFRTAVADWPGSYLAIAGLARTRAAEGKTADAIGLYQKAIAIVPQPEFLAALGDLYQLSGKASDARAQYDLVRAIAKLQSVQAQVYNRQLVLFDANHGEQPTQALALAQRELAVRKDVYGWDADAWALYANGRGRYAEADAAERSARALGTVDPLLDYHAGMIAAALGRDVEARQLLQVALDRNPGFDPLQASRARAELARLGATQ
jgi:tetratricopeptide (TPR) repeat protein